MKKLWKSRTVLLGIATALSGMPMISTGKLEAGIAAVTAGIGMITGRQATARVERKVSQDTVN